MCTTCCNEVESMMRSVGQIVLNVQVVMEREAVQAYAHVSLGVIEVQRVVNQIALQVFKAISDILKDMDSTKSAVQLVLAGVDGCESVGVPVAVCRTMKTSLNTVINFIFAKSIFQQFDTFATTKSPFIDGGVGIKKATTIAGNSAFLLSDGIGFAKWCADNRLIGSRWYGQPISVMGTSLNVSFEQVETTATLVGFASNITRICTDAWKDGRFTPESTLDLASNIGKVVSIVSSRLPKQVASPLSVVANLVSSSASLALSLGRRPGCCWEPHEEAIPFSA